MTKRTEAHRTQIRIFALILVGGDGSKLIAAEMIRKLTPTERRDLRAALQTTDYLLDDVSLAEMAEKRPWKL